jgi:large subunit ribosomal protein L13
MPKIKLWAVWHPMLPVVFVENIAQLTHLLYSDKIKVTGKKLTDKVYNWYTGFPGGLRSITLKDQMKKDSTKVVYDAIYGMLPHKRLGRQLMKHVRIFKDNQHPHEAQLAVPIEIPEKEM